MFEKNKKYASIPCMNKYININNIQVVSKINDNSFIFKTSTSNDVVGIIINNEKFINNLHKIGKGSYGSIYKLDNLDISKSNTYVIKKYEDDHDYLVEKIISMILYNMNIKFNIDLNIIPSYWNDEQKITIMKKYDNDLYHLVYCNVTINYNPFDIFLQVARSIYNLLNYGIYYCDLKLANILYNMENNKVNCILGDIGSIFFSKNNFYTNIFWNHELKEQYIQLKKIPNTKICSLELKSKRIFHIIGYTLIPPQLQFELSQSNLFKVIDINDNHVILRSFTNKIFHIKEIYFNKLEAIFTFPHIMNPDGLIDKIYKLDSPTIENILNNNIFHSLGVFLLELFFKSDFKLRHTELKLNYKTSLDKIKNRINNTSRLSDANKIIFSEILFGNDKSNGLINDNYVNYKKINTEFEELIKKINILNK